MNRLFVPVIALSVGLASSAFAADSTSKGGMSDADKQSYAAGFAQGGQLNKMDTELGVKFNMTSFQKGFDDAYKNSAPALTQPEMEASLVSLQKTIMEKQRTYMEKQFSANKTKGEDFLKTKLSDKNVNKLADGVLYEEMTKNPNAGSDKAVHPTATSTVKVSYVGTTIDGKEFDKNNDVELSLNNLIPGWKTALQAMTPGDKWKLYIPASQAYGQNGAPGIMPNSALIFEVELKDIVKDKDAKSTSDQSAKNTSSMGKKAKS